MIFELFWPTFFSKQVKIAQFQFMDWQKLEYMRWVFTICLYDLPSAFYRDFSIFGAIFGGF